MRIKKLVIILLLIPFFLVGCSKEQTDKKEALDVAGASWPIFRGDAMLTGWTTEELPDKLDLLWTFQTGSWIIGSPVFGDGLVFTGSADGKVYGLDLTDGRKIWEYDTEDDIEASPLLLEGAVYVGNLSGDFFCLDALSGELRWKYTCDNSIYGSATWVRMPGREETCVLVGSYDNRVYCLRADTGELRWRYAARRARVALIDEGLMTKSRPGVWQLAAAT